MDIPANRTLEEGEPSPGSDSAPPTDLERALTDARAGQIPPTAFVRTLISSDVFVVSSTPVEADGTGLRPLLHRAAGRVSVAVFTQADRATQAARATGMSFLLQINGLALMKRTPPDLGITLNPEGPDDVRADISAEGVQRIVQDVDAGTLR